MLRIMTPAEYDALRAELPATLKKDIMAAIDDATRQGMTPDEAVEIVVAAAADLARFFYGDVYLGALAARMMARAGQPISERAQQ